MAMTGLSRLGPLPLRLAVAAPLILHGYQKLFVNDFSKFVESVATFGLPYSEVLAYVAAWGELGGGVLLALGFVTRLAALINAGTMVVAIWKVHMQGDFMANWQRLSGDGGYEFPLVILGACLCLVMTGAGALSVDGALAMKKQREPAPEQ
ncbi:MAG: DoxX family protein [Planctomycetota bacterium JB042]